MLCLAVLIIGSGCSATGGATRGVGEEPVADLVLNFSQKAGAIPTYDVEDERGIERITKDQIEEHIAVRFPSSKREFIRFRIDKATHGRRTGDEVTAIADELARWGQAMGFLHGEICCDVGYLDLQNPRAVIRDW